MIATPLPNSANNQIQLETDQPFTMGETSGRSEVKLKCPDQQVPQEKVSSNNNNEARHVMLNGVPIVALVIDGEERLCLAQISNTLLSEFSYNEIHNRRVALGITCVQCTPVQLEILRRAGAMPVSSRRCGMITKREADRLCRSFLSDNHPPSLPEHFAFDVYHRCAWGSRGSFIPARYNSSRAKCIRCSYCNLFFSPNKFIFHSHRLPSSKYVQPDAANFNSWRRHIKLSDTSNSSVNYAWEDVKAMFNGGSRKRVMSSSSSSSASKRSRVTASSHSSPPPLAPVPSTPPQLDRAPSYFPVVPFPSKHYPCFQSTPTTAPPGPASGHPGEVVWNTPHNLSSIIWSTTLLHKPASGALPSLPSPYPGVLPPVPSHVPHSPQTSAPCIAALAPPQWSAMASLYRHKAMAGIELSGSAFRPVNRQVVQVERVSPTCSSPDIEVNDFSEASKSSSTGNAARFSPTEVEQDRTPKQHLEDSNTPIQQFKTGQESSPTNDREDRREKLDGFHSHGRENVNKDEISRICAESEQTDDMHMHMKLVRDNFFQKLEEERATRLAVQQKLKEAHEALHRVSCRSPTCNCKTSTK